MACQLDHIESPAISLEVYCYFEGMAEGLHEYYFNKSIDGKTTREVLQKINQLIQEATQPEIKKILRQLKKELKEARDIIDD